MTQDLQAKIDALPEWPKWDDIHAGVPSGVKTLIADSDYFTQEADAALARLALRDEIGPMLDQLRVAALNEDWHTFDKVIDEARALLAATEVPR